MPNSSSTVSARISKLLEILTAIRAANPTTLEEVRVARTEASKSVAEAWNVSQSTVHSTMHQELGMQTVEEFSPLVLDWLKNDGTALQDRLEAAASTRSLHTDLAAIREFFGKPKPNYWWVNQGMTFDEERNGGYLWAPQLAKTGHPLQHHVNVSFVKPGDVIFHYSQGVLRAVSHATSPAQKAPRPAELPSAPWDRDGYTATADYTMIPSPIRLDHIPVEWRLGERGPFNRDGDVNQGYLFPLSTAFVNRMLTKFSELRQLAGSPKFSEPSIWLFQANPAYYDLATALLSFNVGDRDDWTVTRYREQMRPGDIAILWQGGKQAGIYALGKLVSGTEERILDEVPAWREGTANPLKPEWRIWFHYTHIFATRIPKETLLAHPILQNMQILRAPQATNFLITPEEWDALQPLIAEMPLQQYADRPPQPDPPDTSDSSPISYVEPAWPDILAYVKGTGIIIEERMLRRYHLSLKTRGFVILSGLSGIGKTWLAQVYADAVHAEAKLVAVAPNWTTNEDLLGYFNPLDLKYHDTAFSRFLRDVSAEYTQAKAQGYRPRPYHLILDEMNLARVEYYFAHFLSAMEVRARDGQAPIALGPETVTLPPNLFFIGTVNIDETTHGFADKIYDRAQLIEIVASPTTLHAHFQHQPYSEALIEIWNAVHAVAPFGFRVLDEIASYVDAAEDLDVPWEQAFDEQVLQKILPKLKGADLRIGQALDECMKVAVGRFSLTHAKALKMKEDFDRHGSTSYF